VALIPAVSKGSREANKVPISDVDQTSREFLRDIPSRAESCLRIASGSIVMCRPHDTDEVDPQGSLRAVSLRGITNNSLRSALAGKLSMKFMFDLFKRFAYSFNSLIIELDHFTE